MGTIYKRFLQDFKVPNLARREYADALFGKTWWIYNKIDDMVINPTGQLSTLMDELLTHYHDGTCSFAKTLTKVLGEDEFEVYIF